MGRDRLQGLIVETFWDDVVECFSRTEDRVAKGCIIVDFRVLIDGSSWLLLLDFLLLE